MPKWTLRNIFQGHFNQNRVIFIEENVLENVDCKMSVILYQNRVIFIQEHVLILAWCKIVSGQYELMQIGIWGIGDANICH